MSPAQTAVSRALLRLALEAGPLPSPCWIWPGARNSDGYGVIRVPGEPHPVLLHRLMYEVLVGPVPDGLELHHGCDTPGCANPAHLRPVTHAENLALSVRARAVVCLRGHPYTPENTRIHSNGTRSCRRCHRDQERGRRGVPASQWDVLEAAMARAA